MVHDIGRLRGMWPCLCQARGVRESILRPRQWQTIREGGTQSHGSLLSGKAELPNGVVHAEAAQF